jgi:HK97 family phage portal protein
MAQTGSSMQNYLPLDDAASALGISRKSLSSSISALNLHTTRGSDRRSYVSLMDVDRINAFRNGEEKANPLYAGTVMYSSPQSQSMERSTRAYIKEGFRADATFYKTVRYIIENGAAIPPKLYTDRTREKEIESHPLLDKLESPNVEQSGVDYRESILGHTLITGNSFQYIIRARKSGPPDELWTLMPDMVHPQIAKPRGIIGYDFDAFEKAQNPIDPSLIGHLKLFSADSAVWGQAPIEAGAILVDQNAAARKWNLACLQNGGRMDGAWVVPTAMSYNDRQKLEEKINAKYRGYSNAGKAPILDAGMVFNPTAYTPTDMDWLEAIRRNSGDIANLYNIPPQLIGDTSATTYNNMKEAKAASYTEAIFPLLDRLYALWTKWLLPLYPDLKNAFLYYDKQTVEVVQEVIQAQKTALAQQAMTAFMQGTITMNEAREIMDFPPIPGGDRIRLGTGLIPIEMLTKDVVLTITPAAGLIEDPEDEEPGEKPLPGGQGQPALPAPAGTLPVQQQPGQEKPPAAGQGQEGQSTTTPEQEGVTTANAKSRPTGDTGAPAALPTLSAHDGHAHPGTAALRRVHEHQETHTDTGEASKRITGGGAGTAIWQDETDSDIEDQLSDYEQGDVTHLRWVCDGNPCPECLENDHEVVAVGDAFPSGDMAPPVHPGCMCELIEMHAPQFGLMSQIDEARERKSRRLRRRKEYQSFMEANV